MSKRLLSALLTLGFASLASAESSRTNLDAFVHSPGARGIVDLRGLSPLGQKVLSEGRVTAVEPRLGVIRLGIQPLPPIRIQDLPANPAPNDK